MTMYTAQIPGALKNKYSSQKLLVVSIYDTEFSFLSICGRLSVLLWCGFFCCRSVRFFVVVVCYVIKHNNLIYALKQ